MDSEALLKKLERPVGRVRAVLDTDTFNEIDDQFALAYMLKNEEKFNILALTAAPFHNEKSDGPGDGMEKSYHEIIKVLRLMKKDSLIPLVCKGSESYLADEKTPVESEAARKLVELALESEETLYVIAIGAITNVASAILLNPGIRDRIVVVWLGGHAFSREDTREFNMFQDVAAARVVFDSGAPVVQLPCLGVVSHLATTGPELRYWLAGKNEICDYLVKSVEEEVSSYASGQAWSRVIWDVAAVAWFLDGDFMSEKIVSSPICNYDYTYSFDESRHLSKVITDVDRDRIFTDLFKKLSK